MDVDSLTIGTNGSAGEIPTMSAGLTFDWVERKNGITTFYWSLVTGKEGGC